MSIFSSLARIEACQKHPAIKSILEGHCWILTRFLENGVIIDIMDHIFMWFPSCVPIVSSLAWIKICREKPVFKVLLWGQWWFLIRNWVILDIMDHHYMSLLNCVLIFSILARIDVCQENPTLKVILDGLWWFLTECLDDWIILCTLEHLKVPPGSFLGSFLNIWLDLAEILCIWKLIIKCYEGGK